jgi:hypothetical protein
MIAPCLHHDCIQSVLHARDLSYDVLHYMPIMTYTLATLCFVVMLIPMMLVVKHGMRGDHYQRQLQHHTVVAIMMHHHYNQASVPYVLVALLRHLMIMIEVHEGALQTM